MTPADRTARMEAACAVALVEIAATLRRPLEENERIALRVAFIKGANWTLSETSADFDVALEAFAVREAIQHADPDSPAGRSASGEPSYGAGQKNRLICGEIRQCVGGWKVCVNAASQEMSGPWATLAAAQAAGDGNYMEAHRLEIRG